MFLQTNDGLLSVDQITLIEDYPDPPATDWRIHYRYGTEIRVTTADGEHVREVLK
jgi:hypothetical protein